MECDIIPEGISFTECFARDRVYIRRNNTLATITLPKSNWDFEACPFAMHYTVTEREDS
jgi:hypothetical protein